MATATLDPRRATAYAAKFRADNPEGAEPTDERMRETFAHCVRVPKNEWLPAIRSAIESDR